MKLLLKISLVFFISLNAFSQNESAFVLYNSKGKKVSYKKLKKSIVQQEYVFFGEYHDNPIAHWLELEVTKELFAVHGTKLQLGFEMFEQDQQMLMNEYLEGIVSEKTFEDSCRLWPNYKTDYKPLIMFAKQNKLFCVASNVPRRYASILFKKGRPALDSLTETDKSYIAPLNFVIDTTLSQYSALKDMEQHMAGSHLMEAQVLKDATMSHFILRNKKAENVVLHYNGAYHSDYHQGIVWYIRQAQPEAKIITISTVTQDNISKLDKENFDKADFIICVPESMTRTH
jgi:uncharacterized iron-regulated protein